MKKFEEILSGINNALSQSTKQSKSLQYAYKRSGKDLPSIEVQSTATTAQKVEPLDESFRKLKNCKYLRGGSEENIENENGDGTLPKELLPGSIVIGHTKTPHYGV